MFEHFVWVTLVCVRRTTESWMSKDGCVDYTLRDAILGGRSYRLDVQVVTSTKIIHYHVATKDP